MTTLVRSIREKLFVLPGGTVCWPGHGTETTIDAERRFNPFVSDAAVGVGEGGRG
jgi:glyoxylase-like metal-dependent hydrolase (beta-lactamase superfamily II)